MKTKCRLNRTSILLMILAIAFTTSCSKEDSQPIQLYYGIYNDTPNPVIDNQVAILFPTDEKTQLLISGGDGDFALSNSDAKIVDVGANDRTIDITPLTTGSTVVTIADKSGNSYTLHVNVDYRKIDMTIEKQDVIVMGDKLSEVQKTEIRQKATLTLPVKVKGGFKLVYNKGAQTNQGQAFIYKDGYGKNGIESVFEEKRMEIDVNGVKEKCTVFTITIDGKPRDFVLVKYIAPKSENIARIKMAINEILTDQFKTEYPDVEFVYTQQAFPQPDLN